MHPARAGISRSRFRIVLFRQSDGCLSFLDEATAPGFVRGGQMIQGRRWPAFLGAASALYFLVNLTGCLSFLDGATLLVSWGVAQ